MNITCKVCEQFHILWKFGHKLHYGTVSISVNLDETSRTLCKSVENLVYYWVARWAGPCNFALRSQSLVIFGMHYNLALSKKHHFNCYSTLRLFFFPTPSFASKGFVCIVNVRQEGESSVFGGMIVHILSERSMSSGY